ncbi:MAG TPA: 3-deoxy-7-phosphoheptulonate synthase [Actinomycetota bacterium]|nr:3-deoxy-7-phosphoheptulonate synthase [Actinomycetota bacterium]
MLIVMNKESSGQEIDAVLDKVRDAGVECFVSRGEFHTVIGVVGDPERLVDVPIGAMAGVERVQRVTKPFKVVSHEGHPGTSTINVGNAEIGPSTFTLIAGPCAVESEEQTVACAFAAQEAGARILRGGAYKPRTSPYSFQGLEDDGLRILDIARKETGMPVVTEVMDVRDVEKVAAVADMLQIGTRNMQNFPLLREVGSTGKPIMLKRGMNATIEEWLMAAEHIARQGNLQIVLCERGIRTFETATRNTLDISAVPVVREESHLPIIIDPSHAAGRRSLVAPLSRAAVSVGADGVMIDVHVEPEKALTDGPQALIPSELMVLSKELQTLSEFAGRTY